MISLDRNAELLDLARTIAQEAEALPSSTCTSNYDAAQPSIDSQLLAYGIAQDRVRNTDVPFGYWDLMLAVEQVIDEAWSMREDLPLCA